MNRPRLATITFWNLEIKARPKCYHKYCRYAVQFILYKTSSLAPLWTPSLPRSIARSRGHPTRVRAARFCRSVGAIQFANYVFHDFAIDFWADIRSFSEHHVESSYQLLLRICFQEITSHTRAKGHSHQIWRLVKGQQNDLHIRLGFAYHTTCLDAV